MYHKGRSIREIWIILPPIFCTYVHIIEKMKANNLYGTGELMQFMGLSYHLGMSIWTNRNIIILAFCLKLYGGDC